MGAMRGTGSLDCNSHVYVFFNLRRTGSSDHSQYLRASTGTARERNTDSNLGFFCFFGMVCRG